VDTERSEETFTLYRCYDAVGRLLYVGQTSDWTRRQLEHASRSAWWPEVERVEMRPGLGGDEARSAERLAIFGEQPIHNTQGKGIPPADRMLPPTQVHFVSVTEAGLILGIGRSTVYQFAATGDLHLVKIGRRSVVAVVEIDRLAARLASEAGVDPGLLASG